MKKKMIQTTDPYASSRTTEIMSRYRPIAPRPKSVPENDHPFGLPPGIQKSPYLRNVWAHLQARPTRTRKRGRTAAFAPPPAKRARATESVALPLFCYQPPDTGKEKGIDLNLTAAVEELNMPTRVIILPRPVRPVRSSVLVEEIIDDMGRKRVPVKGAEEVEEMVEAEKVPTIVSDSDNKVRMCNSAYKELVGQPECVWLDCAAGKQCGRVRRIGGEISLNFVHSKVQLSMREFKCRVKIEWESNGIKNSVNACCHVVTLACPIKTYRFLWRFYEIDQELKTGSGD